MLVSIYDILYIICVSSDNRIINKSFPKDSIYSSSIKKQSCSRRDYRFILIYFFIIKKISDLIMICKFFITLNLIFHSK